jgi:hypothetical protein
MERTVLGQLDEPIAEVTSSRLITTLAGTIARPVAGGVLIEQMPTRSSASARSLALVRLNTDEGAVTCLSLVAATASKTILCIGTKAGAVVFASLSGDVLCVAQADTHAVVGMSAIEPSGAAANPNVMRQQPTDTDSDGLVVLHSVGSALFVPSAALAAIAEHVAATADRRPSLEAARLACPAGSSLAVDGCTRWVPAAALWRLASGSSNGTAPVIRGVAAFSSRVSPLFTYAMSPSLLTDRCLVVYGSGPSLATFTIRPLGPTATTARIVAEVATRLTDAAVGLVSSFFGGKAAASSKPAAAAAVKKGEETHSADSELFHGRGDLDFQDVAVDPTHRFLACYDAMHCRVAVFDIESAAVLQILKGCRSAQQLWLLIDGVGLVLAVYLSIRGVVELHSIAQRRRVGAATIGPGGRLVRTGDGNAAIVLPEGHVVELTWSEASGADTADQLSAAAQFKSSADLSATCDDLLAGCVDPPDFGALALAIPLDLAAADVATLCEQIADRLRQQHSWGPSAATVSTPEDAAALRLSAPQMAHVLALRAETVHQYDDLIAISDEEQRHRRGRRTVDGRSPEAAAAVQQLTAALQQQGDALSATAVAALTQTLASEEPVVERHFTAMTLREFLPRFRFHSHKVHFDGGVASASAVQLADTLFPSMASYALPTTQTRLAELGILPQQGRALMLTWVTAKYNVAAFCTHRRGVTLAAEAVKEMAAGAVADVLRNACAQDALLPWIAVLRLACLDEATKAGATEAAALRRTVEQLVLAQRMAVMPPCRGIAFELAALEGSTAIVILAQHCCARFLDAGTDAWRESFDEVVDTLAAVSETPALNIRFSFAGHCIDELLGALTLDDASFKRVLDNVGWFIRAYFDRDAAAADATGTLAPLRAAAALRLLHTTLGPLRRCLADALTVDERPSLGRVAGGGATRRGFLLYVKTFIADACDLVADATAALQLANSPEAADEGRMAIAALLRSDAAATLPTLNAADCAWISRAAALTATFSDSTRDVTELSSLLSTMTVLLSYKFHDGDALRVEWRVLFDTHCADVTEWPLVNRTDERPHARHAFFDRLIRRDASVGFAAMEELRAALRVVPADAAPLLAFELRLRALEDDEALADHMVQIDSRDAAARIMLEELRRRANLVLSLMSSKQAAASRRQRGTAIADLIALMPAETRRWISAKATATVDAADGDFTALVQDRQLFMQQCHDLACVLVDCVPSAAANADDAALWDIAQTLPEVFAKMATLL